MIAVLDSNSIIFLALMDLNGLKCFDYLKKFFAKVVITPEVFKEVFDNNKFKEYSYLEIDNLEEFTNNYRKEFLSFICNDDTKDLQEFIKNKTGYQKKNGEFYSTAMALKCSRFDGDIFYEFLLRTFMITDDEGAVKDFADFYNLNLIGKFLDIIDLFTLFYLLDMISLRDYLDTFKVLKNLYSKTLYQIIKEVQIKKEELNENDRKGQLLLSQLLDYIDEMNFKKITEIIKDKKLKALILEPIKSLQVFIDNNNNLNRIIKIENRKKNIEKIYKAI